MQEKGTATENYNQSKRRDVKPQEKEEQKDYNLQIIKDITVRLCLLVISEITPVKSYQRDCG